MSEEPIDPDSEAVQHALETLVELEETGTLDDLADAANLVSLASEAVDDDMVRSTMRAMVHAGELFDTAAGEPEALRNLEVMTAALSETAPDPATAPDQVGMIGMMRKMNDPKTKRGMGFLVQLLHELGDQLEQRAHRYDFETEIETERP
ncbi:DUF1641 domain-containing protein [Halodesulfurarchaeum sp.]|uniref:DUF1641 domain-containing protein n=1 Tax=Halodesulfurarchaeum sp. TaxID=1980530 RepID=UPI001BC7F632|nr:DUF1641 domain-containing protein [Halodesulfurarchaeum sp.]